MRTLALLLAALAVPMLTPTARAQDRPAYLPNGPALGASVTRFAEAFPLAEASTAFTFRESVLRRNAMGVELNAGIFPEYLAARALVLAVDGGPGYNVSLPGATLVLRAGPGGILGIGGNDVLFIPGAHVGASAIIHVQSRGAVRLDLLRHFYLEDGEVYPYWSLGFGFAILSSR